MLVETAVLVEMDVLVGTAVLVGMDVLVALTTTTSEA